MYHKKLIIAVLFFYILLSWILISRAFAESTSMDVAILSNDVVVSEDLTSKSEDDELTSSDKEKYAALVDDYEHSEHGPFDGGEDLVPYGERPKTVIRYVNTMETVFAMSISGCEIDSIPFSYGDELECIESTLNNAYVEIILGDGIYIIENRCLSKEEPKPFKIIKDAGVFSLTAYAWSGHRCAIGRYPRVKHTVAAHKKQFPLGTKLYIEGYGVFIVEDRGGFPMGTIDIYMGDKKKCKVFGRRKAHVYVLEWGDNRRVPPEKMPANPSK